MLLNYLKLALKVIRRQKFFSFISLFGISFTLMILMLVTALLDRQFGANAPLSQRSDMLLASRLIQNFIEADTVSVVDSSLIDGVMRYDTTYDNIDRQSSTSRGYMSFGLLNDRIGRVEGAKHLGIFSYSLPSNTFISGKKVDFSTMYTDAGFWEVFDFDFLYGTHYTGMQVTDQARVVVITEPFSEHIFGSTQATGRTVDIGGKDYEVIGVISKESRCHLFSAQVFSPQTNIPPEYSSELTDLSGVFRGAYLAEAGVDRSELKAAIVKKMAQVPILDDDFNQQSIDVLTVNEAIADPFFYKNPSESKRILFAIIGGLLLLFILLPTINLINLNVSRILERASEIGVRKAFGANTGHVLYQFLFENVVLTFLGGVIGLALALTLTWVINDAQVIPNITLMFNARVFAISFLTCLGFGIISGLVPAYRMSRLHISNALKQNQL